MEYASVGVVNDKKTSRGKNIAESAEPEAKMKDDPKRPIGCPEDTVHEVQTGSNASGELNMESSLSSDDVIRAGGFGARDDISSFLPVASDSTDFEASLRDAREYEDPQGKICRPGLGWTATTK